MTVSMRSLCALLIAYSVSVSVSMPQAFAAPAAKAAKAAKGVKSAKAGPSLMPETLGAKAFLEDLLVRRYSQDLATLVDRSMFSLGAQLDLVEAPKDEHKQGDGFSDSEIPSDLMVAALDPEELLKKYGGSDDVVLAQSFLKNYRIREVSLSAGLKDDLPPETKADVEKWLKERLQAEFGTAGKGTVSFIKVPVAKTVPPKTIWDWMSQFQSLAGQIVLAFAILLGTLLWKLIASPASKGASEGAGSTTNIQMTGAQQAAAQEDAEKKAREKEEAEELRASQELVRITRDLAELAPRLTDQFENILRSWCNGGEEGRLKLACFAEAVGKDIGRLPVPVDALEDLTKVFASMTSQKPREKRDLLQKAYWDLLTAMNLGADSLNQPFGYLGGVNTNMISQVLLDENSKLKTLVTLYMPSALRNNYVKSLSSEAKRELLDAAAQMSEIPTDELKTFDGVIKGKLKPGGNKSVVPLNMSLSKLVESMGAIEQITLLGEMTGAAIEEFKRTTPSLAFLAQWGDEKLSLLLSRAMPDEVVAFARVRPDLQDRLISLCPPMTAEVAGDELAREDALSEKDKERQLESFTQRLKDMVNQREINLEEIFSNQHEAKGDDKAAA